MRKFKNVLLVALFFVTATVLGQTKLTGTVVDEMGEPLPGAGVVVKGTTNGTSTDFDGKFILDAKSTSGTVVLSFIGYNKKEVVYSASNTNLGTIELEPSNVLNEIVVTATSFAIDRKTPVAVSTIKASDIEVKLGSQEFPEILKSTPGVYATKSGGGFGDGRINLRGFNSENVAVMINGVPVNDMESGRVFWSNWAGLGDVTSALQVQRGLGASKVAVPSIGGTINILTKTTDMKKGGNLFTAVGNDGYLKYGATVSTGLLDNGFAVTASGSKTTGEGYVDGTQFSGASYFVNISKNINDSHKLSFTSFGSPQRHGQRQNRSLIETIRKADSGIRFNPDWGLRDGNVVHIEDNFYHKSQTSLNHYWTISDKSNLSTALYASWGTGGGGGEAGSNTGLFENRIGGNDQPVDIDNIVAINRANAVNNLGSEAYLRASRNDHSWFGVLSTFKTDLSDNLALVAGVDLRTYTGEHFQEVTDLLGGAYAFDNGNVNNANAQLQVGDKRSYHNDGQVGWQGVFAQLEYDTDNISGFISTAYSNTSYRRVDYFNYLDSDPLQKTDKYNFMGFSTKGGANYNINENHNIFANVGYFEKAPGFDAVFKNFDNEHINPDAVNEKILSTELGYGFRGEKFAANVNLYRTSWNDRSTSFRVRGGNDDGSDLNAFFSGVDAIHQGFEFDFTYKAFDDLTLTGMVSIGDWKWDNDLEDVELFDDNTQELVRTIDVYLKGVKVADAAQTTAALGLKYDLLDKTSLMVDYNYFDNLYSDFAVEERTTQGLPQAWKVPAYHTFDASLKHGFKIGDLSTTLIARMNNVFDVRYIADSEDGTGSVASTAKVWYGFGRTFNISMKINF
jgi:outer membrane cobalamin receptor